MKQLPSYQHNKCNLIKYYTMDVLNYYFNQPYFFTKHHIDSYDDFVNIKLKKTINVLNPFVTIKDGIEIKIYIGGVKGDKIINVKPSILPNKARLNNMTYKFDVYADIYISYNIKGKPIVEQLFENRFLCSLPVMLHSNLCNLKNANNLGALREYGECIYDQGGYFIIDGGEKVIVAQERIVTNTLFVTPIDDPISGFSYKGIIRCTSIDNPLFPKTLSIFVKDDKNNKGFTENSINLSSPVFGGNKIPIFIIFRALGVISDKEILKMCCPNNEKNMIDFLRYSLISNKNVYTQEQALEYLKNFTDYNHVDRVLYHLVDDIFPNISEDFNKKALFFGNVINKLLRVVLGSDSPSDRDSYIYKRVDTSGFLFANLFRDYYNQFRRYVRDTVDKMYLYGGWKNKHNEMDKFIMESNLNYVFKSNIITDGIMKSFKGKWGVDMYGQTKDEDDLKPELIQELNRLSYLSAVSHLRRLNTPLDSASSVVSPHRLHASQWGIVCPCESPDSDKIGLSKNMAIMMYITFDNDINEINKCLLDMEVKDINIEGNVKIFLNGTWVYNHDKPDELFKILKLLKRNAFINVYTSISWDVIREEIHILTEAGRCCRPVFVVYNGKKLSYEGEKWKDLVMGRINNKLPLNHDKYIKNDNHNLEENQGCIEYIDVKEASTVLIAMYEDEITYRHSYCEIHPSTIFGVLAHNIPLCNHNQAPRNIFSGAQGKQAISCYATNFNDRIDQMAYVLHYPQKNLVGTSWGEYLNLNRMPNGQNLILAIMTYSGYNMEDAIIINKRSIEYGLFNVTYYKRIIEKEEITVSEERIIFANPRTLQDQGKTFVSIKNVDYSNLDSNGFPKVNSIIDEGDVILGRVKITCIMVDDPKKLFTKKIKEERYTDMSIIADKTVSGTIDKVYIFNDNDNVKTCKIRLRKIRIPKLGDKSCSRHAQKGVISKIMPYQDMPYTKDGIIPDMIINPHAIPSRMTCAHMLEIIFGKHAAMKGDIIACNPFDNPSLPNDKCDAVLYNGLNNEMINCDIFIGPIFYERLKHMTADKINYRQLKLGNASDKMGNNKILKLSKMDNLTRQPTKGRSSNGGLRIGEMETAALLSHGMSQFIKESMMERSDQFEYNLIDEEMRLNTPYAFNTFLHESQSLGIKLNLSNKPNYTDNNFDDDDVLINFSMTNEEDEEMVYEEDYVFDPIDKSFYDNGNESDDEY